MLPRQHRLRTERDILAVTRRGTTSTSRNLLLQALASPGRPFRATVVVGRKLDKRAVVRNRLKRQVRGVLTDLRPKLVPGVAVVIRVRPPALSLSAPELRADVRNLLIRARLLLSNT